MNRLVIIGNGFDLAHGLPTGYKDFIEDYWNNVIKTIETDGLYEDKFFKTNVSILKFDHYAKGNWMQTVKDYNSMFTFLNEYRRTTNFKFENELFRVISNQTSSFKWVDIENTYYDILKHKIKGGHNKFNYLYDIYQLNEEFDEIKKLLENYLKSKVLNGYEYRIPKELNNQHILLYEKLRPISLLNNESTILQQFTKKEDVHEIKELFNKEKNDEFVKSKLYFLNFNYTNTIDILYKGLLQNESTDVFMNYIHGEIGNTKENKINFGFGDEMDDDYKSIENINDNEYLKNFKSFQYLQNSNYSNLLNFIDSEKFQVLIMGHSCGLSDRTLLNTIFEHKNCRSIKVFFHETKNDKGEVIKDNYTEIIQNISRHFNKKALMREKIVNKTLCKPLPQIQLPKKG